LIYRDVDIAPTPATDGAGTVSLPAASPTPAALLDNLLEMDMDGSDQQGRFCMVSFSV